MIIKKCRDRYISNNKIYEVFEKSQCKNGIRILKTYKTKHLCVHSEKILEIIAFYKDSKDSIHKGIKRVCNTICDIRRDNVLIVQYASCIALLAL